MSPQHAPIVVVFSGRSAPIPHAEVDAWERRRAIRGLKKLGQPVPPGGVEVLRESLLSAKLAMGRLEMERRFGREIAWSDRITGAVARASRGRRRLSQVELFAPGFAAHQLPDWYVARVSADDEADFLTACPDHHLFRSTPSNGQEVWETTGGSPLASRFFIKLDDFDGLITPADPSYPVQLAGAARLADGTLLGGIRHQFRDEADGLRVLLTVEFPWLMGPIGPRAHRWHLACEFTAWIRAAGGESRS